MRWMDVEYRNFYELPRSSISPTAFARNSWTLTGCPVWLLSMAEKIRATDCRLSSTLVSIGSPPSSQCTNFSTSQVSFHLRCSIRGISWPSPSFLLARVLDGSKGNLSIRRQSNIFLAPPVQPFGVGFGAFVNCAGPVFHLHSH